jgi:hypothetical protein
MRPLTPRLLLLALLVLLVAPAGADAPKEEHTYVSFGTGDFFNIACLVENPAIGGVCIDVTQSTNISFQVHDALLPSVAGGYRFIIDDETGETWTGFCDQADGIDVPDGDHVLLQIFIGGLNEATMNCQNPTTGTTGTVSLTRHA